MWENLLRVDWKRLHHAYGRADGVPRILREMISPNKMTRAQGWDAWWGAVNHQGDYYDSTVAAVPFLIEAVTHPDIPDRVAILNYFRMRWVEAPEYGGDPLVDAPPMLSDAEFAEISDRLILRSSAGYPDGSAERQPDRKRK